MTPVSFPSPTEFSSREVAEFERDGFVVVRGLGDPSRCARMRALVERHMAESVPPVEHEVDTSYPGAPPALDAPGGGTIRRLLRAYDRDAVFEDWVRSAALGHRLRQLLGPHIVMSQAHHNCVMTKAPTYSSVTGWHQDIRYWSFERPDLVSAWLALTPETTANGCLVVVPGTHRLELRRDQFDQAQFFRTDSTDNQKVLASQVPVGLEPGDVLFFHARLLHAAGRNLTTITKLAPVFTFHAVDNHPRPGSRSASLPEIVLG
jgi:phytanoyl-CoA hydroxylase